jgi:hypothetical protein
VRTKTQEIPSKSVDCVLSVGALGRSGSASTEVVTEIFRWVVWCDGMGWDGIG